MSVAEVRLWGHRAAVVRMKPGMRFAEFQYWPEFVKLGVEISPIMMPLSNQVYRFPLLADTSFRGLAPLVADSLPDRFGTTMLGMLLATQGRGLAELDAVAKLAYVGNRGMGALEYKPAIPTGASRENRLEVSAMLRVVSAVLERRDSLRTWLTPGAEEKAVLDILQIGSTAGGARAKAVINYNPLTAEIVGGHRDPADGFEPWLIKLDGVEPGVGTELGEDHGVGRLEYAFHLLAKASGITMSECRLLEEGGRGHFLTRRFDRIGGEKLHMQSLAALTHTDYNGPEVLDYREALMVAQRLGLGMGEREELFRRMVFNLLNRNQDDHVKNLSFLMDRRGSWSLSPAYDLMWSPQEPPQGQRMSINGKTANISVGDLKAVAEGAAFVRGRHLRILEQVLEAQKRWPEFAQSAGLGEALATTVGKSFLGTQGRTSQDHGIGI